MYLFSLFHQHYSPLMYACESSNLGMVKVLLKSNASIAFTNQVSKVIGYILTNQRGIRQEIKLVIKTSIASSEGFVAR